MACSEVDNSGKREKSVPRDFLDVKFQPLGPPNLWIFTAKRSECSFHPTLSWIDRSSAWFKHLLEDGRISVVSLYLGPKRSVLQGTHPQVAATQPEYNIVSVTATMIRM